MMDSKNVSEYKDIRIDSLVAYHDFGVLKFGRVNELRVVNTYWTLAVVKGIGDASIKRIDADQLYTIAKAEENKQKCIEKYDEIINCLKNLEENI